MLQLLGLSAIAGFVWVQCLGQLPAQSYSLVVMAVLLLLLLALAKSARSERIIRVAYLALSFLLAFNYALYAAHQRLADQLDERHDHLVSQVTVLVNSLVDYEDRSVQFDAQVLHSNPSTGIPSQIRVHWYLSSDFNLYRPPKTVAPSPLVYPGQVWQMSVLLKRPHGVMNPGGFNYESYLFRRGIRAVATVKSPPKLISEHSSNWYVAIQSARQSLRQAMLNYLHDKPYAGVIIALVIGDQNAISADNWDVFNRGGITHLVSISGAHITIFSGLVCFVLLRLSRILKYQGKLLSDRYYLPVWVAGAGLLTAFAYSVLAGWGVPAQRTFLMLSCFFICLISRIPMAIQDLFILTAVMVLVLDPWAIMAPGFYLSFMAVAILRYLVIQNISARKLFKSKLKQKAYLTVQWLRLQVLVAFAMAPLLILFFNRVSLVAPLVNSYAIFIIGMIVTPMALMLGVLSMISPWPTFTKAWADVCHWILEQVMRGTEQLVQWPGASMTFAGVSLVWTILALIGVFILISPRGIPMRYGALCLLFPVFLPKGPELQNGEWQIHAFDIGQGTAALVRTRHHSLLFDTGPRLSYQHDAATQIIIPALHYLGIEALDVVVVSHTDMDHSGGFAALIQQFWVKHVYASFAVDQFLQKEERLLQTEFQPRHAQLSYQPCQAGYEFIFDEVKFRFLYPFKQTSLGANADNELSCVLLVEGVHHKALLTGDIHQQQEALVAFTPTEVVFAPHHGSNSSSGALMIAATRPLYVIVQAGHHNRYGHPHASVLKRWQYAHAEVINTAQTGSLLIESSFRGLSVDRRRSRKHYSEDGY